MCCSPSAFYPYLVQVAFLKKKEIKTQKNQAELRSINSNGINSDNLLDINDVSILFTKEIGSNSSRVYPSIPVTSKIEGQKTWPLAKDPSGAQGTIWEKNLFDEVIRLAGTQDTQVKNSSGRRANNFQISFFNPP
jgi:hypothetical protein